MKGSKMAKRSSFGSIVRKRLSDITNSLPQTKTPINVDKLSPTASSAKECIASLVKENMALAQLVADNNKIIELSGIELQKLRVNLKKLQLQNWNLAQSNSLISEEFAVSREKLKALQHELVCQKALLKAKNLEHEVGEKGTEEEKHKVDDKFCNSSRRRHQARSKSMGHSSVIQRAAEKGADGNKRRCFRRQSASSSLSHHLQESKERLFEVEDVKFTLNHPADTPMHESIETEKHKKTGRKSNVQESKRISIERPIRKAAEKVQSYKEASLNIKMRRVE